jgi:hypothetical protein
MPLRCGSKFLYARPCPAMSKPDYLQPCSLPTRRLLPTVSASPLARIPTPKTAANPQRRHGRRHWSVVSPRICAQSAECGGASGEMAGASHSQVPKALATGAASTLLQPSELHVERLKEPHCEGAASRADWAMLPVSPTRPKAQSAVMDVHCLGEARPRRAALVLLQDRTRQPPRFPPLFLASVLLVGPSFGASVLV